MAATAGDGSVNNHRRRGLGVKSYKKVKIMSETWKTNTAEASSAGDNPRLMAGVNLERSPA